MKKLLCLAFCLMVAFITYAATGSVTQYTPPAQTGVTAMSLFIKAPVVGYNCVDIQAAPIVNIGYMTNSPIVIVNSDGSIYFCQSNIKTLNINNSQLDVPRSPSIQYYPTMEFCNITEGLIVNRNFTLKGYSTAKFNPPSRHVMMASRSVSSFWQRHRRLFI